MLMIIPIYYKKFANKFLKKQQTIAANAIKSSIGSNPAYKGLQKECQGKRTAP